MINLSFQFSESSNFRIVFHFWFCQGKFYATFFNFQVRNIFSSQIDIDNEFLICSTGDALRIISLENGQEKFKIHDKSNPDDYIVDFVAGKQKEVKKVYTACRSGLLKEWVF